MSIVSNPGQILLITYLYLGGYHQNLIICFESRTFLWAKMAISWARLRHPAILTLIAIIGSNHRRTRWKAERNMATFGPIQLKFNTYSMSIITKLTKHSGKLESMLFISIHVATCCNHLVASLFLVAYAAFSFRSLGESVCLAHFGINPT